MNPQHKKRLSYAKDRRNTYGENSKASRKNLPKKRARTHRAYRHAVRQELASKATEISPAAADALETRVKEVRREQFKKSADKPLGLVVKRKLEARRRRQ
jgi:hypothetical protein